MASQFVKEQNERAITYALLLGANFHDYGVFMGGPAKWERWQARHEDVATALGSGYTKAAAARDFLRRNGYNLNRDGSLAKKVTVDDMRTTQP